MTTLIQHMAKAIISSRELCGNEHEAAVEACWEFSDRAPTWRERADARCAAEDTWQDYLAEAMREAHRQNQ